MSFLVIGVTVVVAYLVGSFPSGYLTGRLKGVDIRKLGSGNIGATNVFRNLGTVAGVAVLLLDATKGFLGCRYSAVIARGLTGEGISDPTLAMMIGGFVSILGHNYTVWLQFKGGKGIATSAGVLAALMPAALGIAIAGFGIVFAISRIVSLGSLTAAVVLPFAAAWTGADRRLTLLAALMSALAIYKHRSNIQRLIAGIEPRVGSTQAPEEKERS